MRGLNLLRGAIALSTLTLVPAVALAQEGGPCTDDIAKLRRDVDAQVGMGAPTSEPDYGQRKGPDDASSLRTAGSTASAKPSRYAGDRSGAEGRRFARERWHTGHGRRCVRTGRRSERDRSSRRCGFRTYRHLA